MGSGTKYLLSRKVGFVDILNHLSPHSEDKTSYSIEAWENISTGEYRFIKEFFLIKTKGS